MRNLVILVVTAVLCACVVGPRASAFLSAPVRIPRNNAARGMSSPSVLPSTMLGSASDIRINKDIVVIGGGLAGLSTALELAKRGRQVTVLSRSRDEAAAEAAGGMIAPQAERLGTGPYLDLCLTSRAMYAEWVSSIEAIAGLGGEKAETHFWGSGGFLSPAFEGDAVHTWSPPPEAGQAHWVDRDQALEMEPSLSPQIVGAWWYPQDMSIDAQRMFRVLEQACSNAGVQILQGTSAASLVYSSKGDSVDAVLLEDGRRFHADAVVSAAGAWMRELMPVPMVPHKGQMMSLREPAGGRGEGAPGKGGGIGLTRVFFAERCYIIPKRDGRVVVGSTVEVGEYGLHNTPAGMKNIIDAAIKVCPGLSDLAIDRTWAGLRPVTPDTFPVLGASCRCPNLFVAGGYWRNGVLLAPKTAQLVADAVCGCQSQEDEVFLQAFGMDRFTVSGGAATPRQSQHREISATTQAPLPTSVGVSFLAEASSEEFLGMERAAMEGLEEGNMIPDLEALLGEQSGVEVEGEVQVGVPQVDTTTSSSGGPPEEPVNDYHASERFSEENLKKARMSNRLLLDGNDASLEDLFGDEPEVAPIPVVKSWEEGAEEVAKMLGAEIVELEVDVPEGVGVEEALSQQGPIMKVLWESPSGEDIEVPRGMNLATMMEAGLIPPFDDDDEGGQITAAGGGASGGGGTVAGVFDPSAVKGAEERSTAVSELYAKVMANKAKSRAAEAEDQGGGGEERAVQGAKTMKNGTKTATAVHGGIFGDAGGSGNEEKEAVHEHAADADPPSAHSGHEREVGAGMGAVSGSSGEGEGEGQVMAGYDFILQHRGDEQGQIAKSARAASRDAPEGEAAWAAYEDIANEAVASAADMGPIEYIPP